MAVRRPPPGEGRGAGDHPPSDWPRRAVLLAAACILAAVAASAERPPRRHLHRVQLAVAGWHDDLSLASGGLARAFRVYVPPGMPARPAVVLLLHGGTQSMRELFTPNAGATRAWPVLADEAGFLLVVPNGVDGDSGDPSGDDQNWNDCRAGVLEDDTSADDVAFLAELVDWLDRVLGIDRDRVYATGASNGGGMTFRLAVDRPGLLAAAAVFIMGLARDGECAPPSSPLPIMICNGTADPLVPWDGGGVAGGRRGAVVSAAATLAAWQAANRTAAAPAATVAYPDLATGDGSTVTAERFLPPGDVAGAEVLFLTVAGGGHTMPTRDYPVPAWALALLGLGGQNRDLESSRIAWEFLSRHRRQGPRLD